VKESRPALHGGRGGWAGGQGGKTFLEEVRWERSGRGARIITPTKEQPDKKGHGISLRRKLTLFKTDNEQGRRFAQISQQKGPESSLRGGSDERKA